MVAAADEKRRLTKAQAARRTARPATPIEGIKDFEWNRN
jgi:hypothetical protein